MIRAIQMTSLQPEGSPRMTDAPFRYCFACRALAVIVLTAGIALAFESLGSTIAQRAHINQDIAMAQPIMLIEPAGLSPSSYKGPPLSDAASHGEI